MEKYLNEKIQSKIVVINGKEITKQYIESLNREEREGLIEPIFEYFRNVGFMYPDDLDKVYDEWNRLLEFKPDLDSKDLFNNSSLATYICKYFCHSFYNATELDKKTNKKKKSMLELYNDDNVLRKLVKNRLGLMWGDGSMESFNLSPRMMVQGFRSMRLVNMVSMFKPDIAKYLTMKYSDVGDFVYDYSAGFGGRMLGVASCDRKYLGVDPLTSCELLEMKKYLKLKNCDIIDACSEDFFDGDNIFDLSFSSPPYFDLEVYSDDNRQAYNKGSKYFYEVYWAKTLNNVKRMLKPNKIFCLNVKYQPIMVDMADKCFEKIDEIKLRTVRSHLNKKTAAAEKYESIYVYRNLK
jgi:hypothetical protein